MIVALVTLSVVFFNKPAEVSNNPIPLDETHYGGVNQQTLDSSAQELNGDLLYTSFPNEYNDIPLAISKIVSLSNNELISYSIDYSDDDTMDAVSIIIILDKNNRKSIDSNAYNKSDIVAGYVISYYEEYEEIEEDIDAGTSPFSSFGASARALSFVSGSGRLPDSPFFSR